MAKQIITEVTCDFDHGSPAPAVATFKIGLDGKDWEIDSCEDHQLDVKDFLDLVHSVGRQVTGKAVSKPARKHRGLRSLPSAPEAIVDWKNNPDPAPTAATATSGDKAERAEIREWARANGFEIGERGRISVAIQEAFAAANRGGGRKKR